MDLSACEFRTISLFCPCRDSDQAPPLRYYCTGIVTCQDRLLGAQGPQRFCSRSSYIQSSYWKPHWWARREFARRPSHVMAPSAVLGDCVECLIEEIVSCYTSLSQLPGLAPSPEVNGLFTKLVRICSQTLDESVITAVGPPRDLFLLPSLTRDEGSRYSKIPELSA